MKYAYISTVSLRHFQTGKWKLQKNAPWQFLFFLLHCREILSQYPNLSEKNHPLCLDQNAHC